jgi:uncharacterized coiled-coil protein SlyX
MNLRHAAEMALEALRLSGNLDMRLEAITALRAALEAESKCNPHPDAPHGFCRNESISEDRYVCECEYWEPPKAEPQVAPDAIPIAYRQKCADGWIYGESGEPVYSHQHVAHLNRRIAALESEIADTKEQIKVLREALTYHMEQTRPIQKTIDALEKTR